MIQIIKKCVNFLNEKFKPLKVNGLWLAIFCVFWFTRPTGQQANRPTGQQANRPTGQQANRPTGQQANRPNVDFCTLWPNFYSMIKFLQYDQISTLWSKIDNLVKNRHFPKFHESQCLFYLAKYHSYLAFIISQFGVHIWNYLFHNLSFIFKLV
jgi:hypothetical protein